MKIACPQCGGEVEFRFDDSLVRVCTFCRAAVVRGDRGVATLGQFADLAETGSPLALLAAGSWKGHGFQLVGRAQLAHPAGGSWDEWYARFDDGRWGWLSEAQGRFYLLFELPASAGAPVLAELKAGAKVAVPGVAAPMTVAEVAEATYRAAAGEIPFKLVPGSTYYYADLGGAGGAFATIDYGAGGTPSVYLGEQVPLLELHISGGVSAPPPAPTARATRLACPSCDGSLELRAPDATMRIGCPYCGAMIEVTGGALAVIARLAPGEIVPRPAIALGSKGMLHGTELTVIGWMRRSTRIGVATSPFTGGVGYPFEEYLLYRPEVGFRWLVVSDGHWSYVEPVDIGEVEAAGTSARYGGVRFRRIASDQLVVDHVIGEMYWKVELGERAQGTDYVAPPAMLSREDAVNETNWSLATWMSRAAVERAFPGLKLHDHASGVAPNQPPTLRGFGLVAVLAVVGMIGAAFAVSAAVSETHAVSMSCNQDSRPPPSTDPEAPPATAAVCFSEPFTLEADKNIAVIVDGNASNSWISVGGDLVNDDTGETESFDRDLEYYYGVEDGESWNEGSNRERIFLDPVAAGRYTLRLELQASTVAFTVEAEVKQGVFHLASWAWLLLIVTAPGLLLGLIWFLHERARWKFCDDPPPLMGASSDDD